MKKIKIYVFFLFILINFNVYANDPEFNEWKKNFKLIALKKGVSLKTIENTIDKSILDQDIYLISFRPSWTQTSSPFLSFNINPPSPLK